MSLDPPPYLGSLQNNIRQRPIPWDGAARAGTITEGQLAKIRAIDKVKKEQRKQVVEGDLDGYRILFVGENETPGVIESASKRSDVVQYVLVLLGDVLECIPTLAKALFKNPDPYKHFLPLLAHSNNAEDPIPLLTSHVLTTLMANSKDESPSTEQAFPLIISYLCGLAKNSTDAGLQDIAVMEYSSLLYGRSSRQLFWKQRSETVAPLIDILKKAAGVGAESSASLWSGNGTARSGGTEASLGGGVGLQLLYHVLLVMWQLSFEAEDIGDEMDDEYDVILLYTQLLRLSPKEKTTRLLLSTLKNLLSTNPSSLLPTAVLARLPALLQNVSGRHLSDPDLLEDLDNLKEMLEEYTKTKTTLDEYVAEVRSGHLRWSPPHRNQTFWTENSRKILEFETGEIARKLAEIMKKPWENDKAVLAIACNDVGFLVKEVPEKRYQLEKLGLKARIMELMQDSDENVRWESLKALGGWLKYSFENN
ncbi:vacuolar ATP synthase subunit H [Pseudomassariella vexata]|uniref:V-type proton ATPase subunit H n=1 Tax=Pseudomassariella vexata TaxID=1141098 RepID=A0A1Y2DBR7_9PEZI|nr:vacuolar ATP synthase subunit H [Pseudomassariella vexata]ORY56712.1 vacuolar ATP synthase subunit H [Pseudomassariella vexata]